MTIAQEIYALAQKEDFSGVVSIFKNKNEMFCEAFGFQDFANERENRTTTRFGIASGTKLFTALGIGKLIQQKKLMFDTKVSDLDKSFCGFIDGDATILQLLTHTSGMYDYYDEELDLDFDNFFVDIPWSKLETPSDYWPLFSQKQKKFSAGERYSYSNGGYVFLAMLIEKLSGLFYRDFISQNILTAANMQESGFFALNKLPKNTALGYKPDRKTTNIYNLPIRGGGDGGMFTTAYDMIEFWEHLMAYRILPEELTQEFLKTRWSFNDTHAYACGIYKKIDNSEFFIVGGDAGVGFDSRYFSKQNMTISILSNLTNGEEAMREFLFANSDSILE